MTGVIRTSSNGVVLTDANGVLQTVSVASSQFDVVITGTNSPVNQGDVLDVTVDVTNSGGASDTQTITLDIDNGIGQSDSQSVSLGSGQSTTLTLSWPTGGDQTSQDYQATVASEDDSTSQTVTVESGGPSIPSALTNRWRATEGSGTSLADSIGNTSATINGANWVSDAAATGGEKLDHDGMDDYIEASVNLNAPDYSALAWFQFDQKNSTNDIMSASDTNNQGFRLSHDAGGDDLRLAHIGNRFNVVTTVGDITTGDW